MAWTERKYSKGEIDRAGRALVEIARSDPRREEAIAVVDNWRSCHAYPLQVIKMTLKRRAKKIDEGALISQRQKRRPSIEIKLRDNPNMQLSQMQDVGGCRAVLESVDYVKKLVKEYKQYDAKSPKDRSSWDGSDDSDYIKNPKPDGYRSVHLIFRFRSPSPERQCFNGQRIEIQIRSKLQHLWATAVETAQVFTGQALKSKVKHASEEWLRFFALTSSAFALREVCPTVPGTPGNRNEVVRELREIVQQGNIMQSLEGWNDTIHMLLDKGGDVREEGDVPSVDRDVDINDFRLTSDVLDDNPGGDAYSLPSDVYAFLLELDPERHTLKVRSFSKTQAGDAQREYERAEKETESNPNVQVVLVSVESLNALPEAYPNYYVDTKEFIAAVDRELNE